MNADNKSKLNAAEKLDSLLYELIEKVVKINATTGRIRCNILGPQVQEDNCCKSADDTNVFRGIIDKFSNQVEFAIHICESAQKELSIIEEQVSMGPTTKER
jgi:hypothetical protein